MNGNEMTNIANNYIQNRSVFSNKGSFNRTLLIGGSMLFPGAIKISANAALKTGVGYVAVHYNNNLNKNYFKNEIIFEHLPLFNASKFKKNINKYKTILFGNGLINNLYNFMLLKKILKYYIGFLIIDATGIQIFKRINSAIINKFKGKLILTPHIGELKNLLNIVSSSSNVIDYKDKIKDYLNNKHNITFVLKSYDILIINYNQERIVIGRDSSLAKAGTGDGLAGLLSGFFAVLDIDSFDIIDFSYSLLLCSLNSLKKDSFSASITITNIIDNLPKTLKYLIS